jgi:anti-sigma regulatory factor (Ser/Thr protein kinase)
VEYGQQTPEQRGERHMKELKLEASIDNIAPVTDWVNEILEQSDCPVKIQLQIDVAIDEIVTNIASYAYGAEGGDFSVQAEIRNEPRQLELRFIDSGIPFDPLQKADPDTSLSAEERQIGGLGIYLVRSIMDQVTYSRKEGKNILSMTKKR